MVGRSGRRQLGVSANGRPVGTWSVDGAEHRFAYDQRWLDADGARPLSLSLALSPSGRPHVGDAVHRWFDNLLPDDPAMRERPRRRLDARSTTAFDLLAETGRDCVGAVQLLPQDVEPAPPSPATGRALDDAGVAALLGAVRTGAPLEPPDAFRLSLAGAQEKTALTRIDGRWHVPSGATPTTHILKLPLGRVGADGIDLSTSVPNEWACLRFLDALGLPVAHASIERFGEHEALVVGRFDRRLAADGRTLLRLPQEDACQALGLSSHAKYETDGGPGIERMTALWAGSRDADDRVAGEAAGRVPDAVIGPIADGVRASLARLLRG